MYSPDDIQELLKYLTPAERKELLELMAATKDLWMPLPGKQSDGYYSLADILGYGGAAGGGKTDLIAGCVLMGSERAAIFRKEKAQTNGISQRIEEIIGTTTGLNNQLGIWKLPTGGLLEFGGLDNPDDHKRWQGRAHDFKAVDEATECREEQVRFVLGWTRSSNPKIRPRNILTFNPPTTVEGRWIIPFFGPWLDRKHREYGRVAMGELLWATTIDGEDRWFGDGRRFVLSKDNDPIYEFDERDYKPEDIIVPKSRTFIPARLTDNPFYMKAGYMATLQSLPEPLRSQMLLGDFTAGTKDDAWQVIPTAWAEAAMDRWNQLEPSKRLNGKGIMDSLGVDVSRGGKDQHIISPRYGTYFDELIVEEGSDVKDGPTSAGFVLRARRDNAPIHIDIVGWGASSYDFLNQNNVQVIPINGATKSHGRTKDGTLPFANLRAELHWAMREALDPTNPNPIAIPDDGLLLADLTAARWKLTPAGILVESKDDIKKRIGRSPDRGDALLNANITTPKTSDMITLVARAALGAGGEGRYNEADYVRT